MKSVANHSAYILTKESPIECYKLRVVSINCIILFALSLLFNSFLLIIFLIKKQLQKPSNIFIFTLTLFNLIGSIGEFPFVIVSSLYCKQVLLIILNIAYLKKTPYEIEKEFILFYLIKGGYFQEQAAYLVVSLYISWAL